MTSQPGLQTFVIHIFPISHNAKATRQWNWVNYKNITRETFFFKNYDKNEAGRLVPDFFLFFKKALYKVRASSLQHSFDIFNCPQLAIQ